MKPVVAGRAATWGKGIEPRVPRGTDTEGLAAVGGAIRRRAAAGGHGRRAAAGGCPADAAQRRARRAEPAIVQGIGRSRPVFVIVVVRKLEPVDLHDPAPGGRDREAVVGRGGRQLPLDEVELAAVVLGRSEHVARRIDTVGDDSL